MYDPGSTCRLGGRCLFLGGSASALWGDFPRFWDHLSILPSTTPNIESVNREAESLSLSVTTANSPFRRGPTGVAKMSDRPPKEIVKSGYDLVSTAYRADSPEKQGEDYQKYASWVARLNKNLEQGS